MCILKYRLETFATFAVSCNSHNPPKIGSQFHIRLKTKYYTAIENLLSSFFCSCSESIDQDENVINVGIAPSCVSEINGN